MADTSSSFSDPGSESEEKSSKSNKSSSNTNKHNNDKGRHQKAPIQATNTMTDSERKRKTEDNNLKSAEHKKTKSSSTKSKTDNSTRSTQFTDEEIKFILFCFFKGKDEKITLDDFFVHFSKTTRTKAAVKAKIGKIRDDFSKQILGLTDTDMEKMGV